LSGRFQSRGRGVKELECAQVQHRWLFPEQRYACVNCGKSCGGWRIWVEPELVEPIRKHALAFEQQVVGTEPGGGHSLRYDERGGCFFLRQDRLCALHADTGWQSKPRACRQFPFFLVQTPDGLQVGLSFKCTAVQQNQGSNWTDHLPGLEELAASGEYPRIGFTPAELGRAQLSWREYLEWEAGWRRGLAAGEPLVVLVWRSLQPLLGLMLDARSLEGLVQSLAATAVGYLECRDHDCIGQVSAALQAGEGYVSARRGPVSGLQEPFTGEAALPDLTRYLAHLLERKTLWEGRHFVGRLLMLLVAEKLVLYYSRVGPFWEAVELVEGEWLGHREQEGLAAGFAATLLQFC
jgi:Fe-S-cluster containining protein